MKERKIKERKIENLLNHYFISKDKIRRKIKENSEKFYDNKISTGDYWAVKDVLYELLEEDENEETRKR